MFYFKILLHNIHPCSTFPVYPVSVNSDIKTIVYVLFNHSSSSFIFPISHPKIFPLAYSIYDLLLSLFSHPTMHLCPSLFHLVHYQVLPPSMNASLHKSFIFIQAVPNLFSLSGISFLIFMCLCLTFIKNLSLLKTISISLV